MKKVIFLFLLFVFLTKSLAAQDLHIYYDLRNDTVLSYVFNGKKITKPKAKMNGAIVLHLKNFNNYLYDVDVAVNSEELEVPASTGFSLLNSSTNEISELFKQSGAFSMPVLDISTIAGGSDEIKGEERVLGYGTKSDEEVLVSKFNVLVSELKEIEKNMQLSITKINKIIDAGKIRVIALNEVRKLKLRPDLPPKVIRKLSLEFLEKALNVSSPEEVNLNNLLHNYNTVNELKANVELLKRQKNKYIKKAEKLEVFPEQVRAGGMSADVERNFLAEIIKVQDIAAEVDVKMKNYLTYIEKVSPEVIQSEQIDHLIKLRTAYEVVANNDFSKTIRIPAKSDLSELTVSLIPKDTSIAGLPKETQKLEPIKVNIGGGIKINISGGLSFGSFKENPSDYYVRDSIIFAGKSDKFIPFLSSFFHFYGQSPGVTSIALSFGVGVPLGTNQKIGAPVFFFGPSLLLGRTNRMVITGGIMSAKVRSLGQGYKIGDDFIITEDNVLPSAFNYQLGGFLGISYNIK